MIDGDKHRVHLTGEICLTLLRILQAVHFATIHASALGAAATMRLRTCGDGVID